MEFEEPLEEAVLLRRYKRFLADVRLADGSERTVHVANPGSMKGLVREGGRCWIRDARDPRRKLSHSLELVEVNGKCVVVNTARGNALAGEAIAAGVLGPGGGTGMVPAEVRAEQRIGASRLDFLLSWEDGRRTWCEVKMVTLAEPPVAMFPDAVTSRGLKHLEELMALHDPEAGELAALLLVVARGDCARFSPAREIDPAWSAGLDRAVAKGVDVVVVDCAVSPGGVVPRRRLTLAL